MLFHGNMPRLLKHLRKLRKSARKGVVNENMNCYTIGMEKLCMKLENMRRKKKYMRLVYVILEKPNKVVLRHFWGRYNAIIMDFLTSTATQSAFDRLD